MTRRSVLITGGSRGIGAAIAHEFAQAGDQIAIHYVSSQSVAEEVCKSLAGDGHITVQADLRAPDAIGTMVDQVALDYHTVRGGLFGSLEFRFNESYGNPTPIENAY